MAVISFSENADQIWKVARWAFRQLLADVSAQYPDDLEMAQLFEQAIALDGLILEQLDSPTSERIARALRRVVNGVLDGSIPSGVSDRYPDQNTLADYREGLEMLGAVLDAASVTAR